MMIGKNKYELDTPCLVIDKDKLIRNIKSMSEYAKNHGKQVRPHAKTHKCPEICNIQLNNGCIGISITKVSEALALANEGIKNLLITSPIVTQNKINIFSKILDLAPETILVIDSEISLKMVSNLAETKKQKINIIVDIDAGIGRTGIDFASAIDLALGVNSKQYLLLKGIQCYAGQIQHVLSNNERSNLSRTLLNKAGSIKRQIEELTGIKELIQTGSGTGTYEIDCNIKSVTEIQPGSYTVMDQEYFGIEYNENKFLPSMTILTTVISANQSTHVTVDAGTKAIYKE
ncbi:MAG: D-serine deaminase-like pyridoxal phosphate-dependent protein, partial [Francisellaceae bacterium]